MTAEALFVAICSYGFGAASAAGGLLYAIRAYKNYRAMREEVKLCAACGKEVKIMLSEEHIEEHRVDQARANEGGRIHVSDGAGSAAVSGKEVDIMLSEEHTEEHRVDQARGNEGDPTLCGVDDKLLLW